MQRGAGHTVQAAALLLEAGVDPTLSFIPPYSDSELPKQFQQHKVRGFALIPSDDHGHGWLAGWLAG